MPLLLQHPDNENRIVEQLNLALASEGVTRIVILVAWITMPVVNEVRAVIREAARNGVRIQIIIGTNNHARYSSRGALQDILNLRNQYPDSVAFHRHTVTPPRLFHPKLYLIERGGGSIHSDWFTECYQNRSRFR